MNLRYDLHRDRARPRLAARSALARALGGLLLLSACGGDGRPPISAADDPASPEAPEAPLRPAPTTLLGDIPAVTPDGAPDPHHHHGDDNDDKDPKEPR